MATSKLPFSKSRFLTSISSPDRLQVGVALGGGVGLTRHLLTMGVPFGHVPDDGG